MAKKIGHVETETGDAYLYDDGSMKLDNSGYVQHLTAEQVQSVWDGAESLPYSEADAAEIALDYDEDDPDDAEELKETLESGAAFYDGEYWDFGEELHIIPSKKEFKVK